MPSGWRGSDMAVPITDNHGTGAYVTRRALFRTRHESIWPEFIGDNYVVYSYGRHFPMYFWDDSSATWFGNKDKYSRTTTRHQSYARPATRRPDDIQWVDTDTLKDIMHHGGYTQWAASRVSSPSSL